MTQFKLCSSLEKVFFSMDGLQETTSGSCFKNEIHSFQFVGTIQDGGNKYAMRYEIVSELADCVQVYAVGYAPSTLAAPPFADEDYITKQPGLFPDPLYALSGDTMELTTNQARAFWVAVEPNGKSGTFPIQIKIFHQEEQVACLTYTLEVLDADLPALPIYSTCWFHGDCLSTHHNVEMMSEAYFEILEKYIAVYAKFGHNMILTPIFTPPLDTVVGGERPTNQLVGIRYNNGKYTFDFTLLKRFLNLCGKYGIHAFEIAHFYTQWGAEKTPKIMVEENGGLIRKFGWDVDATSAQYQEFLNAFLPELIAFLKREGVYEHCFFHVSDEPQEKHQEQYLTCKKQLLAYIDGERLIDALSDYSFYEKGIVQRPVVATNHIKRFLENKVSPCWAYYCCGQADMGVANRFFSMPSYRNRILGQQLYKYQMEGFLQWGYNFWFSQYSKRAVDPFANTAADDAFPSGDSYVVYPLDQMGNVTASLRLYVFNEGMQDLRALKLLENIAGREAALECVKEIEGFGEYPKCADYILKFRQQLNQKIMEIIRSR